MDTNDPATLELAAGPDVTHARDAGLRMLRYIFRRRINLLAWTLPTTRITCNSIGKGESGPMAMCSACSTRPKSMPNNVEATEAAAQKAWMRVDLQNKKVIPTTGYAVAISPIDGKVWVPVPQVDGPQNKIYSLDPGRTSTQTICCLCRCAFPTASTSAPTVHYGSRPGADISGASIQRLASSCLGNCPEPNSRAPERKPAAPNTPISYGSINSIRSGSAKIRSSSREPPRIRC